MIPKQLQMFVLLSAFMGFFTPLVYAGRPLNTDDAGTVAPHEIEMELSYDYIDATEVENNVTLVLTTGILKSLDIALTLPHAYIDIDEGADQNGLSDISLVSKWNFLQGSDDFFDAALSISHKFKNGNENKSLGTGEGETTVLMIFTKAVGSWSFHANIGPTLAEHGDDSLNYNLAAEWTLNDTTSLVSEIFGNTRHKGSFHKDSLNKLIGMTKQLNDRMVYDLGLTFGISENNPDFQFSTGITITL